MDSIELLVDDDTDAALRRDWAALEAAGLPNAGRTTSETNRPHVTLVAAPVIDARADDTLGALEELPLPFTIGGLVLFRGARSVVLARLIVGTRALLETQARVADLLDGMDAVATSTPGRWTPHLTLARRLDPVHLAAALEVLEDPMHPDGSFTTIRRWDSHNRVVIALTGPDARPA